MTGFAPISRRTETIIRDSDGRQVACFTASESTVQLPDGGLEVSKVHTALELMDGTSFLPSMLYGENPIHLACCDICRDPPFRFGRRARPAHGLIRLTSGQRCVRCHRTMCPQHRRRCSDGKYRCPRCARMWVMRDLLSCLFFTRG